MELFIIIVALITVFIILFFVIFIDAKLIFWYIIDKKGIRNRLLKKYEKNGKVIYLLGSLHHMHNNLANFKYYHLKAVLINLKPELLLIESRQEEIEVGNFADGPLEMFYLHMIAKELCIPVYGVDWFSYTNSKPGGTNSTRDSKINENILKYSKGYNKILVVVGATHMLIESKKLSKFGYKSIKMSRNNLDFLFKTQENTTVFPEETKTFIDKRISREKRVLAKDDLDDKWISATKRVIEDLEKSKSRF